MALFGKTGAPTGPLFATPDRYEGSRAYYQRIVNAGYDPGGESGTSFGEVMQAQAMLDLLNSSGVDHISQVPGYERYATENSNSLGQQFADFATNPAVLTAAGGVAGVYAGGAGAAGAGAGEVAYGAGYGVGNATTAGAAGAGAGGAAAGGTGITAGAGGASGLSTTATGASGISTAGTAGTSLSPGYFSSEGLSAGTGVAGAAAGGTALSRILEGNGKAADYLTVFGQVAPSLISAYGSNEQRKSQEQLAAEYKGMGAPYRSRPADLYADPNAFLTSPEVTVPVQQGTDALARSLSTRGNPAGSGTALSEIQNYASNTLFGKLGQEKDRLAGFGGLT